MSEPSARSIAVRVLGQVFGEKIALDESCSILTQGLTSAARGWVQEVASGSVRWKGRLDLAIDSAAIKKKPTGWLRRVLLLAAYQIVVQAHEKDESERTSFRAGVVHESVELVKSKEGQPPAKFANAVLRKICDHAEAWCNWNESSWSEASVFYPRWFANRLASSLGEAAASAFTRATLDRPKLWARALPEWQKTNVGHIQTIASEGVPPEACVFDLRQEGGITQVPGFAEGAFFIQDISSQTLVHELTVAIRAAGGMPERLQALDLCAAPGGKAAGLAWSGFLVTATDLDSEVEKEKANSNARMNLLRQTAERVKKTRVCSFDVMPRKEAVSRSYDVVWVDAPCSGSGIMRRHPDVRWLRDEADLKVLATTQTSLLIEAEKLVMPGGYLMYSVCSVFAEEGEDRVASFLKVHPSLKAVQRWNLMPQLGLAGDGFFAVLMRKN